jgi:hypothetical protein
MNNMNEETIKCAEEILANRPTKEPNNLGYLKAALRIHMETGAAPGVFDNEILQQIELTDNQAVLIRGGVYEIIGE